MAKNLKFLRAKERLTQGDFYEQLGITRSALSSYEDGRAHPAFDRLIQLFDFFKVSIDSFIRIDLTVIDSLLLADSRISQKIEDIEKELINGVMQKLEKIEAQILKMNGNLLNL
ncbi:MAG: helix-turn-helix domain-containing protein [Planktothrix sp.]